MSYEDLRQRLEDFIQADQRTTGKFKPHELSAELVKFKAARAALGKAIEDVCKASEHLRLPQFRNKDGEFDVELVTKSRRHFYYEFHIKKGATVVLTRDPANPHVRQVSMRPQKPTTS